MKFASYKERIAAMPTLELARRLYCHQLHRYSFFLPVEPGAVTLRRDGAGLFVQLSQGEYELALDRIALLEAADYFERERHFAHHRYGDSHEPHRSTREAVVRWSLQIVLHHSIGGYAPPVMEVDFDGWNAHLQQGVGVTLAHAFHALRHKLGGKRTDLRRAAEWLYLHRQVEV